MNGEQQPTSSSYSEQFMQRKGSLDRSSDGGKISSVRSMRPPLPQQQRSAVDNRFSRRESFERRQNLRHSMRQLSQSPVRNKDLPIPDHLSRSQPLPASRSGRFRRSVRRSIPAKLNLEETPTKVVFENQLGQQETPHAMYNAGTSYSYGPINPEAHPTSQQQHLSELQRNIELNLSPRDMNYADLPKQSVKSSKTKQNVVAFGTSFKPTQQSKLSTKSTSALYGTEVELPSTYVSEIVNLAQRQRQIKNAKVNFGLAQNDSSDLKHSKVKISSQLPKHNQELPIPRTRTPKPTASSFSKQTPVPSKQATPNAKSNTISSIAVNKDSPQNVRSQMHHSTSLKSRQRTGTSQVNENNFTIRSLLDQVDQLEDMNNQLATKLEEFQEQNVINARDAKDKIVSLELELAQARQDAVFATSRSQVDPQHASRLAKEDVGFQVYRLERQAENYRNMIFAKPAPGQYCGSLLHRKGIRYAYLLRYFRNWVRWTDRASQLRELTIQTEYRCVARALQAWACAVFVSKFERRACKRRERNLKLKVFIAWCKFVNLKHQQSREQLRLIVCEWYSNANWRAELLENCLKRFVTRKNWRLLKRLFTSWVLYHKSQHATKMNEWRNLQLEHRTKRILCRRLKHAFDVWGNQTGKVVYRKQLLRRMFVQWKYSNHVDQLLAARIHNKISRCKMQRILEHVLSAWKLRVTRSRHLVKLAETIGNLQHPRDVSSSDKIRFAWQHWVLLSVQYHYAIDKSMKLRLSASSKLLAKYYSAWARATKVSKTSSLIAKARLVDELQSLLRVRNERELRLQKANNSLKLRLETVQAQLCSVKENQILQERLQQTYTEPVESENKLSVAELQSLFNGAQVALVNANVKIDQVEKEREAELRKYSELNTKFHELQQQFMEQTNELHELQRSIARYTTLTNSAEAKIREVTKVIDEKNDCIKLLEMDLARHRLERSTIENLGATHNTSHVNFSASARKPWTGVVEPVSQRDWDSTLGSSKPLDTRELEEVSDQPIVSVEEFDTVLKQSYFDASSVENRINAMKHNIRQRDEAYRSMKQCGA